MNKTLDLVSNALNLAQAEIRAMYKRAGIIGSNVLSVIDNAYNELSALQKSHAVSGDVQVWAKEICCDFMWENKKLSINDGYQSVRKLFDEWLSQTNYHKNKLSGYAAAPQKGMKEIKGISEVGELDRYINALRHNSPGESTKILQELFWEAIDAIQKKSPSDSKVWNGWASVKDKLPTDIDDYFIREYDAVNGTWSRYHVHWDGEYFKLMGKRFESENIEWLDESPSDSEAGDGWVSEKPTGFTEDCILLTMSWYKKESSFTAFEILKTDGWDANESPAWYWSINQDGEEWGDYDDLKADKYKIVPLPAPPIQKQ